MLFLPFAHANPELFTCQHLAMIPGRMFGPYITRDIYTTYNSFYCYESTFEIEAVKPEDIGTVYVYVSNEKGHAGAQIHIQLAKDQSTPGKQSNQQVPVSWSSEQTTNQSSSLRRLAFPPDCQLVIKLDRARAVERTSLAQAPTGCLGIDALDAPA